MIDCHILFKLARADADKGDPIPMFGIHIGLELKHKACKFGVSRQNCPQRALMGGRGQRQLQKGIEKELHPKIGHGAAKENWRLLARMNLIEI